MKRSGIDITSLVWLDISVADDSVFHGLPSYLGLRSPVALARLSRMLDVSTGRQQCQRCPPVCPLAPRESDPALFARRQR